MAMVGPVQLHVEKPAEPRDRVRAWLRPLLAIPHALLVGGPVLGLGGGGYRAGALGLVAATAALLDWFAILFTGRSLAGLQGLKRLYLGWRARLGAYAAFLRDEYPPFGEGAYPATLELPEEPATRDRITVALRLILLIPHLVVLAFLLLAELVVVVISWVVIGVTGRLPDALWRFSRDVIAYVLRVEAYGLLVHDQYPPFALSAAADAAPAPPVLRDVETRA